MLVPSERKVHHHRYATVLRVGVIIGVVENLFEAESHQIIGAGTAGHEYVGIVGHAIVGILNLFNLA